MGKKILDMFIALKKFKPFFLLLKPCNKLLASFTVLLRLDQLFDRYIVIVDTLLDIIDIPVQQLIRFSYYPYHRYLIRRGALSYFLPHIMPSTRCSSESMYVSADVYSPVFSLSAARSSSVRRS